MPGVAFDAINEMGLGLGLFEGSPDTLLLN